MLHHFQHSNDHYLPKHSLPFFHLNLTSSFLPIYLLLNYRYCSNTMHYLLLSILVLLCLLLSFGFEPLLPMLHLLLRNNDHYLPKHLSPFFHLHLTSNFLPKHFLLTFRFDYKKTTYSRFLPNLVLLVHHYLL